MEPALDPLPKAPAGRRRLALQVPGGQQRNPSGGDLMDNPGKSTNAKEQPVSELLTQLSQQTSRLVRDELRLAQAELKEKGRHAGRGAGLFGAAGFLAF
jgi:hypothetical protein